MFIPTPFVVFPSLLPHTCLPLSGPAPSPPSTADSFFYHFLKLLQREITQSTNVHFYHCRICFLHLSSFHLSPSLFTLWSFYNSPFPSTPYTLLWFNLAFLPPACVLLNCASWRNSEQVDVHQCLTRLARSSWICFGLAKRDKILITPVNLKSLTPSSTAGLTGRIKCNCSVPITLIILSRLPIWISVLLQNSVQLNLH